MDKYLIELLKEVNTIIIPGLGALMVTNKEKGEYMFMPYLKHDDGTLARHIAEREGWSENDAKNLIAKYVREIEAKLNIGESYDMFQFGSFRKSVGGDIEFEQWSAGTQGVVGSDQVTNAYSEELVEESITPIPEVVEGQQIEPAVAPAEEHNTEEIIDENAYQPEIVEEMPVEETATESIPETTQSEYTEEQQWNDDLDLPPVNAKIERPKKPILEKTQKDRKKRNVPVFLLILLVVLVGAGASVGLFYNDLKKAFFEGESADTTKLAEGRQFEFTEEPEVEEVEPESEPVEEETQAAPVQEESEVQSKPEPKPAPLPIKEVKKTKPAEVTGDFHLIIGSFQNEQYAESFSKKALSAGHESRVIGPKGGFYLVTVGSYSTESEAKSALAEKSAAYPKVWLLKGN